MATNTLIHPFVETGDWEGGTLVGHLPAAEYLAPCGWLSPCLSCGHSCSDLQTSWPTLSLARGLSGGTRPVHLGANGVFMLLLDANGV